MSWRVTNMCAGRRFGRPVHKPIIMFLADKASNDGSGIWCSKGTIAAHTELGDFSVKRAIKEFVDAGILTESGILSNRGRLKARPDVIFGMEMFLASSLTHSRRSPTRVPGRRPENSPARACHGAAQGCTTAGCFGGQVRGESCRGGPETFSPAPPERELPIRSA